ncbi:MAG: hypothetical protein E7340_02130 [Clostridiales bacterium]|nr:hypothetical protein [Clostridiales bacterium]
MKKVLFKIFTFVLALCCVGLVACDNSSQNNAATLVDFENSTLEVAYGESYNIADYVYDSEGNRYEVTATITDSDNQKVEAEKVFQVVKASYKVVYSVNFNGENVSKTVSIKAFSVPMIEFGDNAEQTYTLGILPVEFPAISASDLIDGTITNITKEVYFQSSYKLEKMEDYDGVSNYYVPKKIGTYFWKVTATNSAGQSNSRVLYFYITKDPGTYDLLVYEGGETAYKSSNANITFEYVTPSEFPIEGINNEFGYDKPAYKIAGIPNDALITADFGYTAKEYLALEAKGEFNAVEFYYMIDSTEYPTRTSVGNNDQRINGQEEVSYNDNWTFFSSAGYYAARKSLEEKAIVKENRYITTNKWQVAIVPVSEFVKSLGTGKTGKVLKSFMYKSQDKVDLYISDVKFIQHDWNSVPNKGPYGITVKEYNYNRITASKGVTVSYETELPSTYSYKGVTGAVDNTIGYDGNAVKFGITANAQKVYATFNYTAEEFLKLEQEGKFNAVKFTVMTGGGSNNSKTNLISKVKGLTNGVWKTYVISIADFASTFTEPTSTKAAIYQSYIEGNAHDFYVGNIEVIKDYDFGHSHTGGDATKCNQLPICETCQLPYEPEGGIPAHISDGTESCIALPKCSVCGLNFGTFAGHTGGTATCQAKAICSECGEEYGDLGPHIEVVDPNNPGELPTGTKTGIAPRIICETENCDEVIDEGGYVLPALNLVAIEDNIDKVSDTNESHVAKEVVTTVPSEGINNDVNFSGSAFKMVVNHDVNIILTMPYTGEQYAEFASKGAFNAVKFTYMIIPEGEIPSITNNSTTDFANMFGFAGYDGSTGTQLAQKRWVNHTISAENFVKSFVDPTSNNVNFFKSFTDIENSSLTFNFYFGDIQCIDHSHTGGTATCLAKAICDECGEAYGDLGPHKEVVTTDPTLPSGTGTGIAAISHCETCGIPLSNGEVLPAMNFVPSSTDNLAQMQFTSTKISKEYVANANLPTNVVTYVNRTATEDDTTKYSGNAIKMSGINGQSYYVQLPYTPDEYKKLAEAGAFDTIKFYFLVEKDTATFVRNNSCKPAANSNPSYAANPTWDGTWSMLSGAGYYTNGITSQVPNLPLDGWICAEIDVTALCDSYVEKYNAYRVIKTQSKYEYNIYLGNVEFIKASN